MLPEVIVASGTSGITKRRTNNGRRGVREEGEKKWKVWEQVEQQSGVATGKTCSIVSKMRLHTWWKKTSDTGHDTVLKLQQSGQINEARTNSDSQLLIENLYLRNYLLFLLTRCKRWIQVIVITETLPLVLIIAFRWACIYIYIRNVFWIIS